MAKSRVRELEPTKEITIKERLSGCHEGTKIWFEGEKQGYEVRVSSQRYLICTKPFNLQKTVLYTIIDLEQDIRGTDNLVFGMGYESREDCLDNMVRLLDNQMEVSHRNRVKLEITKIYDPIAEVLNK